MKHVLLGRPLNLNREEMPASYCIWDPGKEIYFLASYLIKWGWGIISDSSEFICKLNVITEAKIIYEL